MTLESKKKWIFPKKGKKKAIEDIHPILSEIINTRELEGSIKEFLNPTLESIPQPSTLYGAKKAAKQIIKAVKDSKKIYIHGDFDADGISATAILWEFIYRELSVELKTDINVVPYIPDRGEEGYGLSEQSIEKMIEGGAELVITVDCGIRDKEVIHKYMKSHKIEFIVTDHHQPPEDIDKDIQYTVVHQNYPKHGFEYTSISGAAVAFLLIQTIREVLKVDTEITVDSPGLDLVALSTVTDMMPLTGVNRVFVKYGLEQMKKKKRLGMNMLMRISNINAESLESYHFGFVLGPRINAAGRIGNAMDALRLLVERSTVNAQKYASELDLLNRKRQDITYEIFNKTVKEYGDSDNKLMFIHGEDWNEGIIGLIAGKLLEQFGIPVIVSTAKGGEVRGSARSIPSFNITDAITKFSKYLVKFGGHTQAAGFTVKEGKLEEFKKEIVEYVNEQLKGKDLSQELMIDVSIESKDITMELYKELDRLKPFGFGNKKPVIALSNVKIIDKFVMGDKKNHMKLKVQDENGEIDLIMFRCDEDIEQLEVGDSIDVVGNLSINEWNGNTTIQYIVNEWRKGNV